MSSSTSTPQEISERARQVYQDGDFPAAAGAYAEAAEAFSSAGDALNAAEMMNNASVAWLRAGEPQASLEAVQGTEVVFAQAGDLRRQGMALANQASALEALKRRKEALDCYQQSADILEKAGEDELRLQIMQLLSAYYLRHFKFIDAVIALQSGLAGLKNPTPRQRLMKKILFVRL